MTKVKSIYHCTLCGHIVEVLNSGAPSLVCCGKQMEQLDEKFGIEGKEKHVPVIEAVKDGVLVKVGSIPHPMTAEHRIVFIEVITNTKVLRKDLSAEDAPEALFCVNADEIVMVREYCNIHGLWKEKA